MEVDFDDDDSEESCGADDYKAHRRGGRSLSCCTARVLGPGSAGWEGIQGGFLGVRSLPVEAPLWQRFVGVFREAGLIEGQHVVFERRFAEGQAERYPELAAQLATLRLDLVVTAGVPAASAAREAMPGMAIVAVMADLVGNGFAATVARPGGNITGFSYMSPEVSAKRLELLREAAPRASRIGVLWPRNMTGLSRHCVAIKPKH